MSTNVDKMLTIIKKQQKQIEDLMDQNKYLIEISKKVAQTRLPITRSPTKPIITGIRGTSTRTSVTPAGHPEVLSTLPPSVGSWNRMKKIVRTIGSVFLTKNEAKRGQIITI